VIDMMAGLCRFRDYKSRRSSSWDRSGGNKDYVIIAPGQSHELLKEAGAGCVRHFYWTYIERLEKARLNFFRGLVLRAFWDGSGMPSIEVPLGDFFGVSNGQVRSINQSRIRSGWSGYLGFQLLPAHAL
jgi:hypothetical protein